MADYIPKFGPTARLTLTASAAVTGGRLVVVSGAQSVAHAGADAAVVAGVASQDAAIGAKVGVFPRAGVHKLKASGVIAAGARVATAAAGLVSATGTNKIGTALEAAADGDVIDVLVD